MVPQWDYLVKGELVDAVEMRALIRGAVKADLLTGWYWYVDARGKRRYILTPADARLPSMNYSEAETETYCQGVAEAGIEPIYHKGKL